jgi:hypothetical protein
MSCGYETIKLKKQNVRHTEQKTTRGNFKSSSACFFDPRGFLWGEENFGILVIATCVLV